MLYGKLWCMEFQFAERVTDLCTYTVRARLAEAKAPGARANRGKTGEPQLAAHGVEKTAADIQLYTIKSKIAL